ncbi:GntR family transcriptional regulator [Pseudomonas tolaasii]|uniref:GntR family transcriptional regulator n=2 Tax=Pseudomonas tolaasii TaxID=29442 RepID=A0A7Y8AT62_PSETO|nr:GntR family transcriptional regulator [Pseudomonas tolaasii]ARB27414.1 GntR family transcriptional regulator [Pseudomonas tolaasii]KAB0467479.1 GntR family transcriptional regulator [Pseudomonas tolaasii]MBY8943311.1 GntR family transcriptional regulator [Pseudomonas tolaasii]NVZ48426.1 GntR family transcriptional regulator [Pseudomonas tolaasii]NWA48083.1 GntR family transcriptional regulator [Pseudomonas tolaasii]
MSRPTDFPGNPSTLVAPTKSAAQLRELAYAQIKQRIISCEFRPGDAINEAQLTAALGIGRTPIHQALHRLEVEGMVTIMPRKGVMVTALSLNDVLDMIEVRVSNEQLCVKLAVERAKDADIQAMRDILEQTPALLANHDVAGLMALDLQFHMSISAAAHNRVLAELLRNLHEKQARFWYLTLSENHHSERIYEEHLQILEAVEQRDGAAAIAAIHHHIDDFRRAIMRTL